MTVCQWSRDSYHALESGFPTTSLAKRILENLDHRSRISSSAAVKRNRDSKQTREHLLYLRSVEAPTVEGQHFRGTSYYSSLKLEVLKHNCMREVSDRTRCMFHHHLDSERERGNVSGERSKPSRLT